MKRLFVTALCLCLIAFASFGQGGVRYSNTGTNLILTVYPPGYTNNNSYLVLSNQTILGRARVSNVGSSAVMFVKSFKASDLPQVKTNPCAGLLLAPGEFKTLEEYPMMFPRSYSAYTTNTGAFGKIFIDLDF